MQKKPYSTNFHREGWAEPLRPVGLKMFTRDGICSAAAYSLTTAFLTAFALALGADAIYIGLLAAVPMIFWTAALLPAALFCQKHIEKRKWIVVIPSTISRLLWIPVIAIALFMAPSNLALALLLIFVTVLTFVGAFFTPAWSSLVGDLVPEHVRGRYMSKRIAATTASGLAASLVAGYLLDVFNHGSLLGFALIFTIGLACSLVSSYYFARIPNPPSGPKRDVSTAVFRDALRDSRFKKFLIIFGIWQFGIMIAAPFQPAFILDTLNSEYVWLSILAVVAGVAGILVQRGWGIFSDRYGSRVIMIIAAFGTVPAIIFWLPATSAWMLVPVEIFSGIMWAGFSLANYNYMLETASVRSRAVCAALFSTVIGIAGIFGPIIGGYIIQHFTVQTLLGYSGYRVVFLLSGILRLACGILFLFFLGEIIEKRERVRPGFVFGQMMRYGAQGGLMRVHVTAVHVTSDASLIERGIKGTAKMFGKDVKRIAHATDEVVENISRRADRAGEHIADAVWPNEHKDDEAIKQKEKSQEENREESVPAKKPNKLFSIFNKKREAENNQQKE